jgi:hypothetical protein
MSPPRLTPTPSDLALWRVLLARDPSSPSGLCWRWRPRELFKREADWVSWTIQWAWKPAGTLHHGVWRVVVGGRKFGVDAIIAELERSGPDTLRSDGNAVAEGTGGTLADILDDARRAMGLTLSDLTVLSSEHDPYRLATPRKRREAQWFAEQWSESDAPHLRGFHYKLIGRATKPDGSPYTGAYNDWRWLKGASAAARWLGLIPFEDFEDRRSDDPVIYRADRDDTELTADVVADFDASPPTIDVTEGDAGEISLTPTLGGMTAEQRYIIAIFGEKSSPADELRPVAVEMHADLYLGTGEQSITHVHDIAARAVADGRPLIVPVVTDCDPSGYQMAVSIARKLQALRDLKFPSLDFDVIHVGLTPDQVREFGLPSSPLSENEKRKARWTERMGVEQTEIDSLLALHPGALARLVRDALAPYFDPTLHRRVRRAEASWRDEAEAAIQERIEGDADLAASLAEIEARASAATARIETLAAEAERVNEAAERINAEGDDIQSEIESINAALRGLANEIDLDPPDVPEAELPDRPTDGPGMVLSSAWNWVEATQRLKARKAYENGDDDDTEAAP